MQEGIVQVMLASEYPEVRDLLSELAREEPGTVIVGQAENGIKATALARGLRPDVAVLDCHLPHTEGLDAVPLSRVGGLDAALAISHEVRTTRVILVGNLDDDFLKKRGLNPALGIHLSRQTKGGSIPLTLRGATRESLQTRAVVFANVETFANVEARQQKTLRQRVAESSDMGILFGGLAIFGGVLLIGTMVFAIPGAIVALAGVGVAFLGVAGRVTAALWLRVSLARGEPEPKREQKGQGR